jgi:anaerobic selenocysteine-containing dehydrogenase
MDRLGFAEGDIVRAETPTDDGVERSVDGLRIVEYSIPVGCIAGYYPECNPLIPMWHYAKESMVPAAKAIDVRLRKAA